MHSRSDGNDGAKTRCMLEGHVATEQQEAETQLEVGVYIPAIYIPCHTHSYLSYLITYFIYLVFNTKITLMHDLCS